MINRLLTKLVYKENNVTIIGIQVQKSFDNPGLIANVAFQSTDNTWCVKMCGIDKNDLIIENIVEQIFEHGCNLDKELAEGMFPFIHLEYKYC